MALAENPNDYNRLEELSESEFEIADDQPDIMGWDVRDADGHKVGEVDELLFNPTSCKVRYIVLHMENNDIDLEDGRVLLPIGVAELHESDDNVIIPEVTKDQIMQLPIYERGREINSDTEAQIRNVFVKPDANVMVGTDFYDHDHFNETKFYGKRRQPGADNFIAGNDLDDTPPPKSPEEEKYHRGDTIL